MSRILLVGLDCAAPRFAFERYADSMPCLSALRARGASGVLRSCEPPITVPAWTTMLSGRDPGELGLYGFRNRLRGSYDLATASSKDVKEKRVWDRLGEAGRTVAALFVPLTYPPTPVRGTMVSCFLTPDDAPRKTFPPSLGAELEARFGPYRADVREFRTDDKARVFDELVAMTDQHFAIARHVWNEKRPDFLAMVEMGPDRLHHAFYAHMDPSHPAYAPESPWADHGRRYYAHLDARLGELLADTSPDDHVLVVSDHGARPMLGGVAVNELLRREGFLALRDEPTEPVALREAGVDWARTRAFGEGGYYARIFLNVAGRDPEGVVAPEDVPRERERLRALFPSLPGPDGRPMANRVVAPDEVYRRVRGEAPDLLVYLGDLDYRSIGTVGHGRIHLPTNDTGPDACNHDWAGLVVAAGPRIPAGARLEGAELLDVARTLLELADVPAPAELGGTSLLARLGPPR